LTPIQILLLSVIALLIVGTFFGVAMEGIRRRDGFLLTVLWVLAALGVIWPDATTKIARTLGIGRGLNLVLYTSCLVMAVGFLLTYVRLRRLDRELTLLSRHIALKEAVESREE